MESLNKQTVVGHPETGNAITLFSKENKEGVEQTYGKVLIQSVSLSINKGFVSPVKRTAFVTLNEKAIQLLKGKIIDGKPYPMLGKIVVKETLEPQYEGHEMKINPSTGDPVTISGYQVFRSTEFTTDMEAHDELVNSNAVKDFELKLKAKQQLIEADEVI